MIIYGPPGVGKTAAARLVLEEAKKNGKSPFKNRLYLLNWMQRQQDLMNEELPIR